MYQKIKVMGSTDILFLLLRQQAGSKVWNFTSASLSTFRCFWRSIGFFQKNVLALLIYFHLRDYRTKKLSRKTSSSLSTWLNNAILGGIPVAETHTPGVANSWVPRDSVSVTLWWRLRSTMMTATQTMVTATTPPTTPTVTTWTGTEEPLSSSKTVSTDDIK